MGIFIRELLTWVLGKGFGEIELILGSVVALALWCLDYAIIERRRNPRHALVLTVAASVIVAVLLLPQWDVRTLLRIGVAGIVYYGLVWLGRRATRKHDPR